MTKLARLAELSEMILDHQLAAIRNAAAACDRSKTRLHDLEAKPTDGLDPITAAQAGVRYEAWADARRREINIILAQQTAQLLEAQATAKQAFGRADVLRQLARKHRK